VSFSFLALSVEPLPRFANGHTLLIKTWSWRLYSAAWGGFDGFYADSWLREARDRVGTYQEQPAGGNYWNTTDFERISQAVEKAIKAALVECHGSIPQQYDHNKLVSLCQTTGVWDVLPPALKSLVEEVESYRAANASDAHGSGTSSPQQLQKYFVIARRLIDYMEYHVIGNDSVLRRLKVA
jgi:HEPN domain-containing protein